MGGISEQKGNVRYVEPREHVQAVLRRGICKVCGGEKDEEKEKEEERGRTSLILLFTLPLAQMGRPAPARTMRRKGPVQRRR